jgi:hypothetical protein
MLFYKAWLETRLRFSIAVLAVIILTAFYVLWRPSGVEHMQQLIRFHPDFHRPWWFDRQLNEYRFYIWRILFNDELRDLWLVCALVLAVGGLTQENAKGTAAFTLSFPVRRRRLAEVHLAVVAAELGILAVIPTALLPVLSPLVNNSYSPLEAVGRGLLLATGGLVVLGLAFLLSAMNESAYIPVVVCIGILLAWGSVLEPYREGLAEPLDFQLVDLFRLISGPPDFDWDALPWPGVLLSLTAALILALLAIRVIESRDYR